VPQQPVCVLPHAGSTTVHRRSRVDQDTHDSEG
jgi:hypothetical protein